MSKIVCDVCGATYPETESVCPICGTAKASAQAAGDTAEQSGYAYVKGGRFSKANVRKRNSGNQDLPRVAMPAEDMQVQEELSGMPPMDLELETEPQVQPRKAERPAPQAEARPQRPVRRERRREEEPPKRNVGLIVLVVILVIGFLAVCIHVGMKWVERINHEGTQPSTSTNADVDSTDGTGIPGPVSIPCTGLRLPLSEDVLTAVGQIVQLSPIVQPENTTEDVGFISADPRIATVDDKGNVTAVADGETTIYVTCGSYKVEFKVICNVGVTVEPTTAPTTPEETEPTQPPVTLKLNRSDFTLNGYQSKWNLYTDGAIPAESITWTSSNNEVATVTNGVVVAVGNGMATITAEYEGQKATCIVRCGNVVKTDYRLSSSDITLYVGGNDTYTLQMYDADGLRIEASELTFSVSKEGFFTVDETGKITALQSNYGYYDQYVYVEYDGVTLKCIVRVRTA